MTIRFARLLFLAVLLVAGCLFAIHRQTRAGKNVAYDTQSKQEAINSLKCSLDANDHACNAGSVDDAARASRAGKQSTSPGKLDYPAGFKQFDTSDPDSPYQQDTYEPKEASTSEKVIADEAATYLERVQAWTTYNPKYTDESHNPVIWQTFKEEPAGVSAPYQSWIEVNKPKWSRTFISQADIEATVQRLSRNLDFLKETFDALPARVLQLDFLRYITLFKDGGVYADIDTSCYVPIDSWYSACYTDTKTAPHGQRVRSSQPGLIVGVEFDLQGDPRIEQIDGRQLALANYVFAANKGHPVLAKMISKIALETFRRPHQEFDIANMTQVHAWTGRKLWTETIIAHIQSTVQGFREADLLGLKKAKMFNDVCILPLSAFGSGQLKFKNSPDSTSEGVMVKHFMMHLWES